MPTTRKRDETFTVLDGHLVRAVAPARGRLYRHRCPLVTFERVAHAVDEAGGDGFTLETLVECEGLPFTPVSVALAFMKERGCVTTRYRRNHAATDCVYLDAMTEFYALAEQP